MRSLSVAHQWFTPAARADSGHARWLLWSLVTAAPLLASCVAPDEDGPAPATCEAYRVDSVRVPDEIDSRAAAILAAVFRTYDEHDLAATWQAHLDERLAADLVWTVNLGGCAPPDALPLGALADVGGLGGADLAGWHPVSGVSLRIWPGDGELDARIEGELDAGYAAVIAEAFVPYLDQLLAAGDTRWGGSIDTSGDGRIDRDELLADPLFQVLTRPDRGDRLSFGFTIHATEVGTAR